MTDSISAAYKESNEIKLNDIIFELSLCDISNRNKKQVFYILDKIPKSIIMEWLKTKGE